MKKKFKFILLMLFLVNGIFALISCTNAKTKEKAEVNSEKNISVEINTVDKGVIINGIKWATRNVDKKGTFTNNPEDIGMLYQWNSIVGWDVVNLSEDVIINDWN